MRKKNSVCTLSEFSLESIAQGYDTVIVYAGLRAVSARSGGHAFSKIHNSLVDIKNLCFPGFTPSFRKTGVYSVLFSKPEIGAFSNHAWTLGVHRTLDPIHSVFVVGGKLEFEDVLDDTFHPEGVFKGFAQEGACIVNIGTPSIVSTNLHYIERLHNVPYLESELHEGVIYDPYAIARKIKHKSYKHNAPVTWNRKKIENLWTHNGCIRTGCWNGAICRVIDGKKSTDCLSKAIKKDPWFLVKF